MRNDSLSELDKLFEKHGVTPQVRFELDNDFAVMGLVNQGLGYGLFASLMLRDTLFDLVTLEPEIPMKRTLCIAVRSLRKSSRATQAFLAHVQEWVALNHEPVEGGLVATLPSTVTPKPASGLA